MARRPPAPVGPGNLTSNSVGPGFQGRGCRHVGGLRVSARVLQKHRPATIRLGATPSTKLLRSAYSNRMLVLRVMRGIARNAVTDRRALPRHGESAARRERARRRATEACWAVAPSSRPTIPKMSAPSARASSTATTRFIETLCSREPPPTEVVSSASSPDRRDPSNHLAYAVSQPSSFVRAVNSETLSVGA